MEKFYDGDIIPAWVVQKVLINSCPSHVTSVTEAAKMLASEYRMTAETLRCYASLGVPPKSKARRMILKKYYEIEADDKRIASTLKAANENLIASIDAMTEAFEKSRSILLELRKEVAGEKNDH